MNEREEVRELLEEIVFRLKTFGKTDTDQTIKMVCEGIKSFLERQSARYILSKTDGVEVVGGVEGIYRFGRKDADGSRWRVNDDI